MDYSQKFFPNMKPMNIFLALLIVMLVCALFGAVTGFFIAYLNVPPFILSLIHIFREKMALVHESGAFAVAMDIDAAGLPLSLIHI